MELAWRTPSPAGHRASAANFACGQVANIQIEILHIRDPFLAGRFTFIRTSGRLACLFAVVRFEVATPSRVFYLEVNGLSILGKLKGVKWKFGGFIFAPGFFG